MGIAKKHSLKVLEDCAPAHGAEFDGQKIGTFGDCASFSFYPDKNSGAYGDAGGLATNSVEIARVARMIANHGQEGKQQHLMEGRNSRMDGLQAAVLSVKLKYLKAWTAAIIPNAATYSALLEDSNVFCPPVIEGGKYVFHLYVIRSKNRDLVMGKLKAESIGTAIHYPTVVPFLPCYKAMGHTTADFPVAYKVPQENVSLPTVC